jgi:hypothetical protein
MRVKRQINPDTIEVGSLEWKRLTDKQRDEQLAKRNGWHYAKVLTEAEIIERGIDPFDFSNDEPRQPTLGETKPKYEVKSRTLSAEEFSELPLEQKMAWKGHPVEYMESEYDRPGDMKLPPSTRGVTVTEEKKRTLPVTDTKGVEFTFQRLNPHGYWVVLGLEHDLGTFLGFKEAHAALTEAFKQAREESIAKQEASEASKSKAKKEKTNGS